MYSAYFTSPNLYTRSTGIQINGQNANVRDLLETMRSYHSNFSTYQTNMTQCIDCLTNIIMSPTTATQPVAPSITPITQDENTTQVPSVETNYISIFDLLNTYYDESQAPSSGLSVQMMLDHTTISSYKREQYPNTETCPITLEPFTEGEPIYIINQCGHLFKSTSLMRWFLNHNICPMCRITVGPDPPASNQETPST